MSNERERQEWLDYGLKRGWLRTLCMTHDWLDDMTSEEEAGFELGDDPCMFRMMVPRQLVPELEPEKISS